MSETESIVVRVAGDSGDGIQLVGSQFVVSTAHSGSDFTTFQDFPAEIRAPLGSTFKRTARVQDVINSRNTWRVE